VSDNAKRMMDIWREGFLEIVDDDEYYYILNKLTYSDDEDEHDDYFNKLYTKYQLHFYDLLVR
jgi:hypothetical protein